MHFFRHPYNVRGLTRYENVEAHQRKIPRRYRFQAIQVNCTQLVQPHHDLVLLAHVAGAVVVVGGVIEVIPPADAAAASEHVPLDILPAKA
jgi:hypothetical protein